MPRLEFFSDCIHWPEDQVDDLNVMRRAGEEISRATFLKHVDSQEMKELEQQLGYERDSRKGLTMAKDFHVGYYKSKLRGCPAVYFVWSAIEHVFTDLKCVMARPPEDEESKEMSGSAGKTFTIVEQSTKEVPWGLRDIPEDHTVFRSVERVIDGPASHAELNVGDKMTVRIRASGTSGIYNIWRTS
jgi:hypothetical protein